MLEKILQIVNKATGKYYRLQDKNYEWISKDLFPILCIDRSSVDGNVIWAGSIRDFLLRHETARACFGEKFVSGIFQGQEWGDNVRIDNVVKKAPRYLVALTQLIQIPDTDTEGMIEYYMKHMEVE